MGVLRTIVNLYFKKKIDTTFMGNIKHHKKIF